MKPPFKGTNKIKKKSNFCALAASVSVGAVSSASKSARSISRIFKLKSESAGKLFSHKIWFVHDADVNQKYH